MTIEHVLPILLFCLILAQNVYWSRIVNELVDKLMSKNYFEYAQGKRHLNDKPPKTHQVLQEEAVDPESERQAQELNSLFPMV